MLQGLLRGVSIAGAAPVDFSGATGVWSFSRQLVSSYVGSLYTTNTGAVDVLFDQSGSVRNLAQGTAASRPIPTTAGPNSRACGQFDGSDDSMTTGLTLANFISASSGYMIATIYITSFPTNNASSWLNSIILGDGGSGWARMTVRSGNIFYAFNWDGNEDKATGTVNVTTAYVVEWRHDSGNIYQRVNGAGETSVASGNTANIGSGSVVMGGSTGTLPFAGMIFEVATWSTVPDLATRDALVQSLGTWVGASV